MPQIAVGSTVVPISNPATSPGINGINAGSQPIYCGPDPTVNSASASQTLAEGDVLNWPAGQPLYVVCAPGQVSIFQYSNNGATITKGSLTVIGTVTATLEPGTQVDATITNASVPVTGNVNATIENASIPVTGNVNATIEPGATVDAHITNASIPVTGNVNATIENASIPVTGTVDANITNANIALAPGTTVDINSGTVNVGNTPNVNSFGSADELFSFQWAAANGPYGGWPGLVTKQYSTLYIDYHYLTYGALNTANYDEIVIEWADSSNIVIATETLYAFGGADVYIARQVLGPQVIVSVNNLAGSKTLRAGVVNIIGATNSIPRNAYYHDISSIVGVGGNGNPVPNTTLKANSTGLYYGAQVTAAALFWFSHSAGPANFNYLFGGTNGTAFELTAALPPLGGTNAFVWASLGTTGSSDIILPECPIAAQFILNVATNISVVFEPGPYT